MYFGKPKKMDIVKYRSCKKWSLKLSNERTYVNWHVRNKEYIKLSSQMKKVDSKYCCKIFPSPPILIIIYS